MIDVYKIWTLQQFLFSMFFFKFCRSYSLKAAASYVNALQRFFQAQYPEAKWVIFVGPKVK